MSRTEVRATELPAKSLLHGMRRPGDFLDCYACPATIPVREAAAIIAAFPDWARMLLRLRNLLMRPFGLRAAAPADQPHLGPFPIVSETPDEILLGFDDRHLDFRISVLASDGLVHCSTWVAPHNPAGRIYLTAIMPFHVLIVRNSVARVGRAGKALA